ncbi:hypothetical protein NADFUDRAFT_80861 [Nadsonia fulvescens var. elongata DSM 6958]|uniref:THO complex subunit 1 n=1 Tax=Nadsonia fulvescens var. elongata DSM 6958 TaxID=857566 RepID=A0A1E3PDX3_9ASCO|nr:hypothetical protein NADFUDRAFT_80861 [Nadsonia fulvescens var. elongata DSM 6958]
MSSVLANNRLQSLLSLFPVIENPVKTYFFSETANGGVLAEAVIEWFKEYQAVANASLETDAREYIYGMAGEPLDENNVADDTQGEAFLNLCCQMVDTFLLLSSTQLGVEIAAAHTLLEDILSIKAIGWCQLFWPYLESRESMLCSGLSGVRAPGTTLIRLCNALLKRTSRNRNARFAGRILCYLARAFPLAEKSGLNKNGEFNTDNVTIWEDEDDDNDSFYNRFWSLQPKFADPTKLFTQPELLTQLKLDITLVMDELKACQQESHKAGLMKRKRKDRGSNTISTATAIPGNTPSTTTITEPLEAFIPKYLTRRNLFDLQLKDTKFRRSVLAQIFIFARFMISLGSVERAKWTSIGAINKSVMFNFILEDTDVEFFQTIINNLTTVSHAASDLSGGFVRALSTTVLVSDINWTNWKLKSCSGAPFDAAMITREDLQKSIVSLNTNQIQRKPYWYALGTASLSQLWKVELGLPSLGDSQRWNIKDTKTWWSECKDLHREKVSKPEDPDISRLLASKTWQGLRAARAQGYWTDFGKVANGRGFGGLFDDLEFSVKPAEIANENAKNEKKSKLVKTGTEPVETVYGTLETEKKPTDDKESPVDVAEGPAEFNRSIDLVNNQNDIKDDYGNTDTPESSSKSGTATPVRSESVSDTIEAGSIDIDSQPHADTPTELATEIVESSSVDSSDRPAKRLKIDD